MLLRLDDEHNEGRGEAYYPLCEEEWNDGSIIERGPRWLHCTWCSKGLNTSNVRSHMEGAEHKFQWDQRFAWGSKACHCGDKHLVDDERPSMFTCTLCDKRIFRGTAAAHLDGNKHKGMALKLLDGVSYATYRPPQATQVTEPERRERAILTPAPGWSPPEADAWHDRWERGSYYSHYDTWSETRREEGQPFWSPLEWQEWRAERGQGGWWSDSSGTHRNR